MEAYEKVVEMLNGLDIPFEIVEHEPALTTEQADSFIEEIEGIRTKTMFLTNKKKNSLLSGNHGWSKASGYGPLERTNRS